MTHKSSTTEASASELAQGYDSLSGSALIGRRDTHRFSIYPNVRHAALGAGVRRIQRGTLPRRRRHFITGVRSMPMRLRVGDVRIETEPTYEHDGHHDLWTRWTEAGSEYSLLIARDQGGFGVGYLIGKVQDMLRHAYEQGRTDAALGF